MPTGHPDLDHSSLRRSSWASLGWRLNLTSTEGQPSYWQTPPWPQWGASPLLSLFPLIPWHQAETQFQGAYGSALCTFGADSKQSVYSESWHTWMGLGLTIVWYTVERHLPNSCIKAFPPELTAQSHPDRGGWELNHVDYLLLKIWHECNSTLGIRVW